MAIYVALKKTKVRGDQSDGTKGPTIVFQSIRLRLASSKGDFVPFLKYPDVIFANFFAVELRYTRNQRDGGTKGSNPYECAVAGEILNGDSGVAVFTAVPTNDTVFTAFV
jgi:hypothetical protein